ncbi:hypothetical protein B0H13DRAFT_1873732 [Mycena leptocephala]|nr:hypothetical protein B0H13DRAFT_1873732 [Mycena leptocephala]
MSRDVPSDSSTRTVVDLKSENIAVPESASPSITKTQAGGHDQAMPTESTVEEILRTCERFRIVSVGGSGAGKSSLINSVFKVNDAKVSHSKPGEADIYSEITSATNERFVLHDSEGFEPANMDTFEVVRDFIIAKSNKQLELKDRLHAVWLCIQTPTDGARVLETGDEEFLKLAHERQIPAVVVFTQYDRLVRKYDEDADRKGIAQREFDGCIKSLLGAAKRLNIDKPTFINVSVRRGYDDNILTLVDLTRQIVEERLKGDAWIMWAIAQKASLPLKIDACVAKGMSYYWRALTVSIPVFGNRLLLRECLLKVHHDIIACWNIPTAESDMQQKPRPNSSPVDIEKISQFVALCTAATAVIAPPVAILGLTYFFISSFSPDFRSPDVERVLIAYTVDLILVLEELFKIVLQPKAASGVSWNDLQEAFEAYHRTTSQRTVHGAVNDLVENRGQQLITNFTFLRKSVEDLVQKHRGI